MFCYEKKLQYPVRIKTPNPKLAAIIISQYGGPNPTDLQTSERASALTLVSFCNFHQIIWCAHKKRRRRKPAASPVRKSDFLADILAGVVSGLITAAIQKLLNW